MKSLTLRLVLLGLFALAFVLLLPQALAYAHPPAQPPIPHPLAGHADCVSCHATGANGAPQFPADHVGRTNDMCLACHVVAAAPAASPTKPSTPALTASPTVSPTVASSASETPTVAVSITATATSVSTPTAEPSATPMATQVAPPSAASGAPNIPHPLQGRDNCLACHQTGVGGAPKVPADHAGRTIDMCRTCHQPAPAPAGEAPQVVPTQIPATHPVTGESTCVTCHLSKGGPLAKGVQDWQSSIHAQRGVTCVDCHGGDPTSTDNAMDPKAGFVGKPNKVDIPALCASCHARVEAMRQYDLPTDQWSKYQQSTHGIKLAQGDANVATCFNCHDGHATKAVSDPAASVYPLNVPALCATCHANAELMKPYGIPTNQYDLYVKSVHGVALLEKQDTRAPSCATCHGTHGAAPPGFQEVANICGSCHSATQEYYLKSQHASNAPGTPKCVTCHGRYDVMTPSDAMFTGSGERDCGSCHAGTSAQADSVNQIGSSIRDAASAVDQADAAIQRAAGTALIVAPEEVKLAEARTNLIAARAAQHTLDLTTVKDKTDKSSAKAKEVIADSDKAVSESIFRREFMIFGLAIMALAIGSLYIIRQELYKQLPKE